MKKIALVVGHLPNMFDGGAVNEKFAMSEFDFNNMFAPILAEKLREREVLPLILYRETYKKLPSHVNSVAPDITLSLHCNAFDKNAHGSEVLYHVGNEKGKRLAECILSRVVECLESENRGVKPIDKSHVGKKGDKGGYLLANLVNPGVTLESFFIDSSLSLSMAMANLEGLAIAVADGVVEYFK